MTKLKIALTAGGLVAAALLGIAGATLAQSPAASPFTTVQADQVKWASYPAQYGEWGMKTAAVMGDSKVPGLYVERMWLPPHVMSSPHTHPNDRVAYVLKGTYYVGTSKDFDPTKTIAVHAGGMILIPRNEVHFDGSRDEEVIVQFVAAGQNGRDAVNPADPPFRKFPG